MDLAASLVIRNRNISWVGDNMVTQCHNPVCKTEFSFYVRKHHCRSCGNIFCHKCSDYYITIPKFIKDRPDEADYWNISYYITALKGTAQRVCEQCYDMIKEKTRSYEKISDIINNPIPLEKIKELSQTNTDIKHHYFDHLRNIQYYLPNHVYSDIDKKLLRVNANSFSQHSKYLVHLIKSIDWTSYRLEDLQLIVDVVNGDKNKTCQELFCTRTCEVVLSCDDCINILFTWQNLPDVLLKYLFDIIMKTPEQIILCHLPFFITMVKTNYANKLLQGLLYDLLSQSKKMTYHAYWFLCNEKQPSNVSEMNNIKHFIDLFDNDLVRQMDQEYRFFVGLINNLDDQKGYLMDVFDTNKPISLPYDPDIKLIGVDFDNISCKSSYTKPVVIPFETDSAGVINLLFKKESITNDITVLNLMTLCDIILSETLKDKNFSVVVYPTMPLTANSGMIEIIDKAETVHAIVQKKKTIFKYIIHNENNGEKRINDVLTRYMYSLVSYTLHSYFLGLADRHSQNIMVTEDGAIFHIDFGYILGNDAYPLTGSEIKLNSDMLDVIGGADSKFYNDYLNLCSKGITILRKYFNMFYILLSQNTKFKDKHIEKFVMARFQPRQIDSVVIEELMTIIKQSNDAFNDYVRDFLHYHTQEKTVQSGLGKIIKTAFGTVRSFTNSH